MPSQRPTDNSRISPEITDDEVVEIICEQLPHWKLACDQAEADTVILQQSAFGRSLDEIFLLHCAIRYAGIAGKTVMIAPFSDPGGPDQ